jgi:hypothetical protein
VDFEIDVLDPGLGQHIAEVFRVGTLHRPGSQGANLDLLIERSRIRKYAIIGGLRIEFASKSARTAAESTDEGKRILRYSVTFGSPDSCSGTER